MYTMVGSFFGRNLDFTICAINSASTTILDPPIPMRAIWAMPAPLLAPAGTMEYNSIARYGLGGKTGILYFAGTKGNTDFSGSGDSG